MKNNNIHKIIIVAGITLASMNLASAESFSNFFKSVFDTKSATNTNRQNVQAVATTTIRNIYDATTSSSDIVDTVTANDSTSTDAVADSQVCELKTKILVRNRAAKAQMKKQTEDKNKIVLSLEKVASSSDATSSKILQEKILKLEKEFSDIVKVENSITDIASTTIDIVCDNDLISEKLVAKNLLKIKKLETEKDKQIDEVRVLIKKEIKNTLKSLL